MKIKDNIMKTLYEKYYRRGFEYGIYKMMGLRKPNAKINTFYVLLIAVIILLSIV